MTKKKPYLSGFPMFFDFITVKLPDGTCRITLYNCEENKDTVNQVMNAAYGVVKENYLLEVTFKTS